MSTTISNIETNIIRSIAADFPRHPQQLNGLLEADAEILKLPGITEDYLVLKTDGIHEEIRESLYDDPYQVGWMTVTAPLSDIAAVGAQPTGILLSLILPPQPDEQWLQQFKSGINDACAAYNIYVLGGDTNFDNKLSVSATAVATISGSRPLLRKGMKPDEHLYATAPCGLGNGYAYSKFFDPSLQVNYQPEARLKQSKTIRKYATACIDTSDGLFPALSVLAEINEIGFDLSEPLQNILHPAAKQVCSVAGLSPWMVLAGPHGDYELLFSIPDSVNKEFEQECSNEKWQPVYLGTITSNMEIDFTSGPFRVNCHHSTIANFYYEAKSDIQSYFKLLLEQHKIWSQL